MTTYGSADVGFFLADGFNLLGDTTKVDDHKEALMEDGAVLGEAWPGVKALGVTKFTLSQKGFYDDAVDQTHAALVDLSGAAMVLVLGHAGNVQERPFLGLSGALNVSYDRQITRLALTKAEAEYNGDGIVEEGIIQEALAARDTDPAEGAAIDYGASSPDGASGYLEWAALALGGYDNAIVKIRDSSDDISYSDLITFTAATAARGAERKTVAGTVDRYTKATWAFTGSGSSESMTFMVGLVRN